MFKTRRKLPRELGHFGAHAFDPGRIDYQRWKIRIRKVTIVMRVFFGAHFAGFVAIRIVKSRRLHDPSAVFDQFDLAGGLDLDRGLQKPERIEVLDLTARTEFGLTAWANGDVGIDPKTPLLHVSVANSQPYDQAMERACIGHGFTR